MNETYESERKQLQQQMSSIQNESKGHMHEVTVMREWDEAEKETLQMKNKQLTSEVNVRRDKLNEQAQSKHEYQKQVETLLKESEVECHTNANLTEVNITLQLEKEDVCERFNSKLMESEMQIRNTERAAISVRKRTLLTTIRQMERRIEYDNRKKKHESELKQQMLSIQNDALNRQNKHLKSYVKILRGNLKKSNEYQKQYREGIITLKLEKSKQLIELSSKLNKAEMQLRNVLVLHATTFVRQRDLLMKIIEHIENERNIHRKNFERLKAKMNEKYESERERVCELQQQMSDIQKETEIHMHEVTELRGRDNAEKETLKMKNKQLTNELLVERQTNASLTEINVIVQLEKENVCKQFSELSSKLCKSSMQIRNVEDLLQKDTDMREQERAVKKTTLNMQNQQLTSEVNVIRNKKNNNEANIVCANLTNEYDFESEHVEELQQLVPVMRQGIPDMNIQNELASTFTKLYDNQWRFAFKTFNDGIERRAIADVLGILTETMEFCKKESASHRQEQNCEGKCAKTEFLFLKLMDTFRQLELCKAEQALKIQPFVKECFDICWLMCIQDPPIVFGPNVKHGEPFDNAVYKAFKHEGPFIDYVVWVALFSEDGGSVLCKGIAECCSMKSSKQRVCVKMGLTNAAGPGYCDPNAHTSLCCVESIGNDTIKIQENCQDLPEDTRNVEFIPRVCVTMGLTNEANTGYCAQTALCDSENINDDTIKVQENRQDIPEDTKNAEFLLRQIVGRMMGITSLTAEEFSTNLHRRMRECMEQMGIPYSFGNSDDLSRDELQDLVAYYEIIEKSREKERERLESDRDGNIPMDTCVNKDDL